MNQFKMAVAKTEKINGKNKRTIVGNVQVTYPTLADVVEIVHAAKIKEHDKETGIPVYEDDRASWVQEAFVSACKAAARNKLLPNSAEVKPGLAIATDWAGFTAESTRDGSGLILMHESRKLFAAWANTLGKSAATVQYMVTMFSNQAALSTQADDKKAKFLAYVEQFCESLEPAKLEELDAPLNKVLEACAPSEGDSDNEFL